jgi:hypothetical protein
LELSRLAGSNVPIWDLSAVQVERNNLI